ncbi:hypothetical protein Fmac_030176 [Flemingia macrophylla]|uniref:Uncharacterized protein n=1 Tax=Flemingia macrophylla TaxID=520843 RepID=A0ABD1LCF9_9FABA
MEVEKRKNKRVGGEEEEESEKLNKKLKGEEELEEDGVSVPTEEEVEEFFAILRRMRVAVKYFDHKRGGREWRQALETAELAVDHSGQEDHNPDKKAGDPIVNGGFDLNAAAPEASEGGGT